MKFNLKNFPQRKNYPNVPAGATEPYNKAVEKWFEGFESELRKKVVSPTNTKSVAVYDVIKEILGDE